MLIVALASCNEPEEIEEKPSMVIIYVHVGSQTLMPDVKINSFGSDPVEDYGIIYGESPRLDTGGNKLSFSDDKTTVRTCTISNLKVNTTYYMRGYITSVDNTITYSAEVSAATAFRAPQHFAPRSASIYDEVTIRGTNFEPLGTRLFVDDIPVDAQVTADAITFFPPFGIQSDSVTLSIEIGGVRFPVRHKLHYLPGRWTRLKPYEDERISFISKGVGIAGKLYVTSANDFIKPNVIREFDPDTEQWTDVAVRSTWDNRLMQCFAIHNQIFILADNGIFVMYDLDEHLWYKLPPHPAGRWATNSGVAFSFHNNGYVTLGGGHLNPNREVWRYNYEGGNWTHLQDFPGKAPSYGLALTTIDAVYHFGGAYEPSDGDDLYKETWKYDPVADTWEKRFPYPRSGSIQLNGISLNGKLYVGGGADLFDESIYYNDFWEYDPAKDEWTRIVDLPVSRRGMYTYSYGNDGYLGSGMTEYHRWYHDVWKFEME